MIRARTSSSRKTEKALERMSASYIFDDLERYGRLGVDALSRATPTDTGLTARSWTYRIIRDKNQYGISWHNTNTSTGVNVAILLQYGHGTGTGGWVQGKDYINPAIQPVFDQILIDIWKKVNNG